MSVTTRRAMVSDAKAIAIAHMRAWQVAYQGMVPQNYLDGIDLEARVTEWRSNLEVDRLPNGVKSPANYVAEVDGHVVGFVCVGVCREAPDNAILGEVWAIYVDPDHWAAGVGYQLMQAANAYLRSGRVQIAYLWVLDENDQAKRFYERQGWTANDETQTEDIGGASIIERRYSITLTV